MLISARPWKLVVLVGGLVATVAGSGILAWLVFDQHYGDRYIFAGLPPGQRIPNKWLESDVIVKADTLEELARKGRPARRRVEATVERFNGFAESGTGSGTRSAAGCVRPILLGLCTCGIACNALVDTLLAGDVSRVHSYGARFAGVVFPGGRLRGQHLEGRRQARSDDHGTQP
jgi:MaoC like domain